MCSSSHHHSSRWATTVIAHVCVYLTRIVCVWRVCRSHHHQCTTGLTVIPMSIFIYIHEPLHGSAYAHYCTHTRKYGGVGFRNENVPQVENLPQLFHPHTYAYPQHGIYPLVLSHPPNPRTLDITTFSPHSHYISTYPCILSYTHAYNIIRKHNPPIGGHGFRISTFSTSITGTYRIPSRTDPHTPLNLRLLFLVFINLP